MERSVKTTFTILDFFMTTQNKKKDNICVAGFYNKDSENPYCRLFYQALSQHDIDFVYGESFNDAWILKQKKVDWLHVHWPEGFWRYGQKKFGGTPRGFLAFFMLLYRLKKQGFFLAWTVHNISHHEGTSIIDRLGYRFLIQFCDLLICHSEYAKNKIIQTWDPKAKTLVMPHGNYDGVYPDPDPKDVILEKLGLKKELPVLSCIGVIRDYKGIDIAVDSALEAKNSYQLLIAGKPHSDYKINTLLSIAKRNKHIIVIPEALSEKQFSNIFHITDVALLPYRNITGSGALLTALTFGCGVVAADLPYFKEIIGNHQNAGKLFTTGDSTALTKAIKEFLTIPYSVRRQAAFELSSYYAWDNVIGPVANQFKTYKKT